VAGRATGTAVIYAQIRALDRQVALLQRYRALYADIYDRSARALREGNLTLDIAGTNLVALLDVESRLEKLCRIATRRSPQLKAVLGLSPDVELRLGSDDGPMVPSDSDMRAAIAEIADRRPDLRALKAGYESQEAKLRQAVLAQFPSLTVGVTRCARHQRRLQRGAGHHHRFADLQSEPWEYRDRASDARPAPCRIPGAHRRSHQQPPTSFWRSTLGWRGSSPGSRAGCRCSKG